MVSTLKFKQQTQIDLKINGWCVAIYGSARRSKYVKQEEFETKRASKGLKRMGLFHK
jgi:hypothetical protein